MRGEVVVIGGGSVGAIEYGKEVWQQVDQHLDQSAGRRRGGTMDAEMIVVAERWNKTTCLEMERRKRVVECAVRAGDGRTGERHLRSLGKRQPQMARFFPFESSAAATHGWRCTMTTLQQIDLQCPICENRFRSQAVVSTNSFGGKRTDFHERAAGTQPLPYLIHTCSRCGYSGSERDFTEDAFAAVTRRFADYLRGLPFSVEFHDRIEPHYRSGKLKTIVVERAAGSPRSVAP